MQSSRRFTRAAAQQIRVLLADTRRAERSRQKALRQQIRDLGFFISDFSHSADGFTPEDFDDLVSAGTIDII